jgi:ferredoxin/flavodoxin
MQNLKFFYFSGTGNSKRVMNWFCQHAQSKGHIVDSIDISQPQETVIILENEDIIGFISPTHGFNFPPIMLNFLFRFPKAQFHNKVFIMNTRGGMKMWKIFLPGYSGIALWLASFILILKGYKVVGLRSIDLPSNWQSLHPAQGKVVVNSMFQHYESHVKQFADKILAGKHVFKPSMILSFFIDIPVLPITMGYYFIGRFILAKTFMASSNCDNCGLCLKNCPIKAISLVNNRPFWSYKCESCMRCMDNCPKRAIEAAHGFLIVVLLLSSVLLSLLYFIIPSLKFLEGDALIISVLRLIVKSGICLSFIFLSYRIVHYLKKFKWFDVLVTYTSFSKLWFWKRYKAPRA